MPSLFRTLPSLDATTDHRRSGGVTGLRAWVVGAICSLALLSGCSQSAAPSSTFVLLDGTQQTTQDLRGKVVLVNFWATSCPSCIREMPAMADTWRKYHHRGFELVAVAMEYDPPEYVMNYAQSNPLPFTVALDRQGDIARAFGGILGTPASFVIDKQGRIVQRYLGEPDFRQLHQLIEARLQES